MSNAAAILISAAYDATTGVLNVTGANMTAGDSIAVSRLVVTGQGGASYVLTTGSVTAASDTFFTVTLNAADKLNVNDLLNRSGASAVDGTVFNLAGVNGWDSTANAPADLTGNAVVVSNVPAPAITGATYNAASGVLVVTGTSLLPLAGAANDIAVSGLSLTGEGGVSVALTSANVDISSSTSFSVTLNSADQAAVSLILNKAGTSATGGATYNLAASEGWAIGADVVVDVDLSGNGVTVSNVAIPQITSATYNAIDGVLTVSGSGFVSLAGAVNDIDVTRLTIAGDSTPYTLTTTSVDVTSATSFTVTLNGADRAALVSRLTQAGATSVGAVTYNLAAAEDWAKGADAAVIVVDLTGNAIVVGNFNTTPVIGNAAVVLPISDLATVAPFATMTVTDPDTGAAVSATIALDNAAKGVFTSASLVASGFSSADGGLTYTHAAATPTALQSAIAQLVYNPTDNRVPVNTTETTTFTVTVSDGMASATTSSTQVQAMSTNSVPTGSISISGNPVAGGTVGVFSSLNDADGLGVVSFQWNADGVPVVGAIGSTFALSAAMVGKTITVSASYTDVMGQPESVTSATVLVTLPPVDPPVVPETPVLTVDGMVVTVTTSADSVSGLTVQSVSVPTVGFNRVEDPTTLHSNLADIAIGVALAPLSVGLAQGQAMMAGGASTVPGKAAALADLLARVDQVTSAGTEARTDFTAHASSFVQNLQGSTLTRSVTITGATTASAPASALWGSAGAAEAVLLDLRGSVGNNLLALDDVDFTAVLGAARLVGGAGANHIVGDGARQVIAAGAGNDVVMAGGGDDVVSGAASDGGMWHFYLNQLGQLQARHQMVAGAGAWEQVALSRLDLNSPMLDFSDVAGATLAGLGRLYHAAFQRAPDVAGVNYWTDQPLTLLTAAQAFIGSAEWSAVHGAQSSAQFVASLYQGALGRTASAAEVSYWSSAIDSGAISRADVLLAFSDSAEHVALSAGASGLVVGQINVGSEYGWFKGSGNDRVGGGTGNDILVGGDGIDSAVFSGSAADYHLVLNRAGELSVTTLDASQRDVLRGIETLEFGAQTVNIGFSQADPALLQTLALLYQGVLGRAGDAGGLNYWVSNAGTSAAAVSAIVGSAEFEARYNQGNDAAFVQALYQSALDRDADAATVNFWDSYLDTHSRADLVAQLIAMPEFLDVQFGSSGVWVM